MFNNQSMGLTPQDFNFVQGFVWNEFLDIVSVIGWVSEMHSIYVT